MVVDVYCLRLESAYGPATAVTTLPALRDLNVKPSVLIKRSLGICSIGAFQITFVNKVVRLLSYLNCHAWQISRVCAQDAVSQGRYYADMTMAPA